MIRGSTVAAPSVGLGPGCLGLNAGSAFHLLVALGTLLNFLVPHFPFYERIRASEKKKRERKN